jgi:hypothetical protein
MLGGYCLGRVVSVAGLASRKSVRRSPLHRLGIGKNAP